MPRCLIKLITINFLLFSFFFLPVLGDVIKKIEITGNERISDSTIEMFSSTSINDDLNSKTLNQIIKNLYDTNFFKDISVNFSNNTLFINVLENPIIQNVTYEGIKSNRIKDEILKDINLRSKSSYNEIILKKDKDIIQKKLKDLGFYFSKIDIFKEDLNDNKINIKYVIDLGEKAKIKKITFIGDKIFKDNKLKSIIVSEEYKFWKFISGKKFLNQNLIQLDTRLLKSFYLNKGYYNIKINSSFAKIVDKNEFEIIFNIDADKKFYFNDLSLKLPNNFEENNFEDLINTFNEIKGEPYSLNLIDKILEKLEVISLSDHYESISASVEEDLIDNMINLRFIINENDQTFVEKINILGNNVTRENVIRNQFEIDEGDPYNEILTNKSINNLKSLNFFKQVKSEIIDGNTPNTKIINIMVEEKPTGEITAGAGIGSSGGTVSFGVKENNYLGKGMSLKANITINQESVKGIYSIRDPNYKNSDKSIYASAQAIETDRLKNFGYKTNKTGFTLGVDFEYLDNFFVGIGNSHFYERISTDNTASSLQKKQEGNYWDSFLNFNFDYDTRNQKFQTTDGFRSRYFIDIPLVSETNTFTNSYDYKVYSELYENNITSVGLFLKSSKSLNNKDIKLSERIFLPSSKLRGFERGKIGPKDGTDFVGGNYAASINFSTTVPKLLENSQNVDVLFFLDAANIWGIDYDSTLDDRSKIRSSIGVGIDWLTPIGPLSFTLAETLSKSDSDVTETFRFNLGTTF